MAVNRKRLSSGDSRPALLTFSRGWIAIARAPTEPRNPETTEVHSFSPFWSPPKNGPKSPSKCPNKAMPKTGFLDILIDFWGHFSGGRKWHFSDFNMPFWGFGVPGLCWGTGRLQSMEETHGLHALIESPAFPRAPLTPISLPN